MIKYLFSNVDKVNGFNEQQIKYLSIDLKTCKSILFVPGDYDKEKYIIYKDKIINWLKSIEVSFSECYLTGLDDELKSYDVIFLMGGNPINQIEIINKINLKNLIDENSNINVLVTGIDRLSRNTMDLFDIQNLCEKKNIGFFDISSDEFIFDNFFHTFEKVIEEIANKGSDKKLQSGKWFIGIKSTKLLSIYEEGLFLY